MKLDGSGRVILRNWVFLKRIVPYGLIIEDEASSTKDTLLVSHDQGVGMVGTPPRLLRSKLFLLPIIKGYRLEAQPKSLLD